MRTGAGLPRAGRSIGLALALAVAACGGTAGPSQPDEPFETDDVPVVTPAATLIDDPTAPPDGNGGSSDYDDGHDWPATVDVTIAGQNYFDSGGSYHATGPARICGSVFVFDPTGRTFAFEFPDDLEEHNPTDVTFSSNDLLPGTTTALFHTVIGIVNSEGHEPPSTVVRADTPGSGDSGTAALTEADGKRTIVVDATTDFGQTVKMTVVCGPAPA